MVRRQVNTLMLDLCLHVCHPYNNGAWCVSTYCFRVSQLEQALASNRSTQCLISRKRRQLPTLQAALTLPMSLAAELVFILSSALNIGMADPGADPDPNLTLTLSPCLIQVQKSRLSQRPGAASSPAFAADLRSSADIDMSLVRRCSARAPRCRANSHLLSGCSCRCVHTSVFVPALKGLGLGAGTRVAHAHIACRQLIGAHVSAIADFAACGPAIDYSFPETSLPPTPAIAVCQVVRASRNLPLTLMKGEYERILRRRLTAVGGSPDDAALQEMLSSFR